ADSPLGLLIPGLGSLARVLLDLVFDRALTLLVAAAFAEVLQSLAPRLDGGVALAELDQDIAEVIVDLQVLRVLVLNRLHENLLGFLVILLLVKDPAEAVEVGAV